MLNIDYFVYSRKSLTRMTHINPLPKNTSYHVSGRLAFDCATIGVSVALMHKGILYTRRDASANTQASSLIPMIESVLHEAGVGYEAIDTLVTTIGPGSFTGMRIGLAAAQGIVAAVPMKIITLNTLEALAMSAVAAGMTNEVWCVLNAGKDEAYSQLFTIKNAQPIAANDVQLTSPEDFLVGYGKQPLIGTGQALFPKIDPALWHSSITTPDAAAFVTTTAPTTSAETLVPLYIRAPDAVPTVAVMN
jgi:tRNA threonylcarbamoyladenosine biosynthesis protein TsaB